VYQAKGAFLHDAGKYQKKVNKAGESNGMNVVRSLIDGMAECRSWTQAM
jgi:hypothetical protein